MNEFLFTSESVTEGHPDKVADQISDGVLDAVLTADPNGHVACEVLCTTGLVVVAGEITCDAYVDIPRIAREIVGDIGYTSSDLGFDASTCGVVVALDEQSPDIRRGVESSYELQHAVADGDIDAQGAGDQGMMFGYACDETPEKMPLAIQLAHRIAAKLAFARKAETVPYLRPDGKAQVTIRYREEDGRLVPQSIERLLVSTQHHPDIHDEERVRADIIEHVLTPVIPHDLCPRERFSEPGFVLVNPTGRFVTGGPMGDTGLTGRKIIVDTYGGAARHGGGAFSGKDPSKVDRSAAYAMRWVAKNIVSAGLAARAEVQVAYAIGVAHPVSVMVETFGTETVDRTAIERAVREVFDLRPASIIRDLDLLRPIYRDTAAYGHFGREHDVFTWERADRVAALREACGLEAPASV
ncbi:MAG TPA: methionine adenosyltransferase [Gaiellales bacterium]|nr:methionine adenosyltransferase [Gaiellales bacterium]